MGLGGFDRKDIFLIYHLWKMNLRDRYLGSSLGLLWAILQPTLYLALYTFVFGVVLRVIPGGITSPIEYLIWMFSGLVPYLVFSEAISTSASSLMASSSLIKNIVFKSEIIPIAFVLGAVIPLGVGISFIIGLSIIDGQLLSLNILMLLPFILVQFIFLIGLGFFLSATTVFFRDLLQVIPTVMMALLFCTPIFYPIESMPPIIAQLTFFNPLYQMVQPYRDVIIYHQIPDLYGFLYFSLLTAILLGLGLLYFRKLKGYFEMVL